MLKFFAKIFPSRYREIPRGDDPDKPLLEQFALVKGRVYLRSFVGPESDTDLHSHPWRYGTLAIGLRGTLIERRLGGEQKNFTWKAPYFRYMGPNFFHHTTYAKNHLSIFIGLGKKTDDKFYVSVDNRVHWSEYIRKMVERL